MGRWFSTSPKRLRAGRTRRRVLSFAEALESRQLLSVGAVHPTVAPLANVPALFGPAFNPGGFNLGSSGSAGAVTQPVEIVIEVNPTGAGGSVAAGPFIVGGSFSGTNVSPAPAAGNPTSPAPVSGNASTPAGANTASTAQTPSITPLTTNFNSGAGVVTRAPIFAIVLPQLQVANLTPSTMPVTTQAILATATLEEQPLAPPVLGQGFESAWTQGSLPRIDIAPQDQVSPETNIREVPQTDHIEPYQPGPGAPVPGAPVQPVEPPAIPALPRDHDRVDTTEVEPVNVAEWGKAPKVPVLSPPLESQSQTQTPSMSMAAMLGTAAIATGGYHLVLGRSNRFNQRWLPLRRSSTPDRERRNEDA